MTMKGQMFIIAMIFIIAVVVLVKNMVSTLELTEENRFQTAKVSEKNMKNFIDEYRHIAAAAAMQAQANQSGLGWLADFSMRLREDQEARIFFVLIVTNGSSQRYSVAIGNYLGDSINITYNVTNSSAPGNTSVIADGEEFVQQHAPLVNGTIAFTAYYTFKDSSVAEKFNFTNSGNNSILLFTDVTAGSDDFSARGKDVFRWSWPV